MEQRGYNVLVLCKHHVNGADIGQPALEVRVALVHGLLDARNARLRHAAEAHAAVTHSTTHLAQLKCELLRSKSTHKRPLSSCQCSRR